MSERTTRRQLTGPAEVARALDAGVRPRLVLAADEPSDPSTKAVLERAAAEGIPVRRTSAQSLWRLGKSDPPAEVLALVGPAPDAPREEVLAATGCLWMLVGIAYPGNTGFAIRAAEVSGADGVFIDGAMLHEGRREALRASMRADRFMPVFWEPALPALQDAQRAGRRVFAVEDVGTRAPWEFDLTVPSVFVLGGERHGIPADVLDACDEVIRLPMRGFIPSYNLQAAMAMVAGERLRQTEPIEPG